MWLSPFGAEIGQEPVIGNGAPGGAAPTPTGAEASPASRRGRSQGFAKAGLATPLAPPGAPLPRFGEGRKRGKGESGALKIKAGAQRSVG